MLHLIFHLAVCFNIKGLFFHGKNVSISRLFMCGYNSHKELNDMRGYRSTISEAVWRKLIKKMIFFLQ